MRIAFHSPLNDPTGRTPSGDRLMARQIMSCLTNLGHEVQLVSGFRSWLYEPDALLDMEVAAAEERARIGPGLEDWQPDLWFTYHLYYRAPDLLGPELSRQLKVPYVAAEASWSPKRQSGPWASTQARATAALCGAQLVFAMTERDAQGLALCPGFAGPVVLLPPFLADPGPEPAARFYTGHPGMDLSGNKPAQLLTVAMMRHGDKLASYRTLAAALAELPSGSWHLTVIGDGPAHPLVEALFGKLPLSQITWRGMLEPAAVQLAMDHADMFVWPGINEAFGMVFLEAQARSLPVVAMASAGVPSVVTHGLGGLLAREGDVAQYAEMILSLVENVPLRLQLGRQARDHVMASHDMSAAMRIIGQGLEPFMLQPATDVELMKEHSLALR